MRSKAMIRHTRSGFTLIEMLAVVAIIAVMAGFISLMNPNPQGAQGLTAAQNSLASLMQTARVVATSKGTHSRLIINVNPDEPDNYLRQAGIVYSSNTGNDPYVIEGDEKWAAVGSGILLPQGTYYMPPEGGLFGGVEVREIIRSDEIGPTEEGGGYVTSFEFPIKKEQTMPTSESGSGSQWIYYEFSPDGIVMRGSANKKVIVYAGRLIFDDNKVVEVRIDNSYALGGFLLTMLGGIVSFPDKETADG